jgi:recombination and repair protein|nr:MAG TPA: Recombination and repair protein [Caudoviricetes sp.]DAP27880.1 MAG TPA: Recombination and repair protein [Caudoviricetes sp.]
MKIKSIKRVGKKEVYDIEVKDAHHYILENGVASHNSGPIYSANTVFFVTRAQEKEGKDLTGYQFTLVAHKSRDVRENSKIPITVEFDNGIKKWSGLFDIARELGWIDMPSSGWYTAQNPHTKELIQDKCRAKDIEQSDEFWEKMLAAGLDNDIQKHYRLELVQTDK